MYIENDFIDEMKKEDTDPIDDASEHDIQKAVVEICGDAEKTIRLSRNAIYFVQLGPNLVPRLLCRVAIFSLSILSKSNNIIYL